MNVERQFTHGARGNSPSWRPDFKSQDAERLGEYFHTIRHAYEQDYILKDRKQFSAAVEDLTSNSNIARSDFVRVLTELS